jgi:hypothetical protein
MKPYGVVILTAALGACLVAAAAAAASAFGGSGGTKAGTSFRAASSLQQIRDVNFITTCRFSHENTDDPIVFPGLPGKSHDHTFFGNNTTNAFSTLGSLLSGTSSCRRPGDTAAYWVPTLVSAQATPIQPVAATIYYRRRSLGPVTAFPPGLRMIAGNSKATTPQSLQIVRWDCGQGGGVQPSATIPTCPDARQNALRVHITFPSCWDGVNLDSPDHQSHMAYPMRGRCPSDHPVATPQITLISRYAVTGGPGLFLSSGGQLTGHSDFFNAWNQGALQSLVNGCLNALRHCAQGS